MLAEENAWLRLAVCSEGVSGTALAAASEVNEATSLSLSRGRVRLRSHLAHIVCRGVAGAALATGTDVVANTGRHAQHAVRVNANVHGSTSHKKHDSRRHHPLLRALLLHVWRARSRRIYVARAWLAKARQGESAGEGSVWARDGLYVDTVE